MLCLNEEITCSQMTDRHILPAWGLKGGKDGGLGATLVKKKGDEEWLTVREAYGKPSTSRYSNLSIRKGDRMRLVTPSGGGYGDPTKRDRASVAEDIREGYVSEKASREHYGYQGG